jgi:lysosomal acid lipase/cholesteryl ester hydrolase
MKDFFKGSKTEIENPLAQDEDRTIEEIIAAKGFKFEKHSVKTEDGYTLIIYRIPGGKDCKDSSNNQPILFQHGIFDSSDGWVCNGEEHSIPFIFAKNDFDVWISNSRGNKYCKNHEKYDTKSFEFWQFSFHEMGIYDIPAVINYINSINKSGEKIIYFGHSQGTSLMFSGLTQKFEFYKKNIKLFVALAPVARLANIGSSFLSILSKISIHKLVKKIRIYEMGPSNKYTTNLMNFMENYATSLTNFFINLCTDSNSKECNDQNALAVYLKHSPCGCSLKCLIHFVQIIKSKKFIYYDYKKEANFALYHQIEPPEYDLSVIKDFPIMLIGGELDKLGTPDDIRWLNDELSKNDNVIYFKILPSMGHLSFMVAKDFSWFDEPFQIIMEKFVKK